MDEGGRRPTGFQLDEELIRRMERRWAQDEPAPRVSSRRPRRGLSTPRRATVFAVAVIATIVVRSGAPGGVGPVADLFGASFAGGERPPASDEAQDGPLGFPAPVLPGDAPYEFILSDGGDPVAYDPCRPIHVVMNPRTAPPEGAALVEDALAIVSRATGLQFVVDAPTAEVPTDDRRTYQPERYGERWAPVLVAWSDPTETPRLAGDVAGLGGSVPVREDGRLVYVSGTVVLDGPSLESILFEPGGGRAVRAVILHELGHLVGLAHVDDPTQLMHHDSSWNVTDFGQGDRTGLAALGQGRCFPDL